MSKVKDRQAHPLPDGRVDHRASIVAGGTTVPWACVCTEVDNHDHDAIHGQFADRLEQRGKVIGGLHALVGRTGRVGLIRYEVTDCNIQIHGPAKFVLYVAWTERPLSGGEQHRQISHTTDRPETFIDTKSIAETIEDSCRQHGDMLARATRHAGDFVSK